MPKIFQNRLGASELLIERFLKEGSKPTVFVPKPTVLVPLLRDFTIEFPDQFTNSFSRLCIFFSVSSVVTSIYFGNHFPQFCRHSQQSADWSVFKLSLEIPSSIFHAQQSHMATRRGFIEGTRGYVSCEY